MPEAALESETHCRNVFILGLDDFQLRELRTEAHRREDALPSVSQVMTTLGFSAQKAVLEAWPRNPELVRKWATHTYPDEQIWAHPKRDVSRRGIENIEQMKGMASSALRSALGWCVPSSCNRNVSKPQHDFTLLKFNNWPVTQQFFILKSRLLTWNRSPS